MKTKIFAFGIVLLLAFGNVVVLVATSEGNQPSWPDSWNLADIDPNESGSNKDYRDVNRSYYFYDDDYLYFRMECFGSPTFTGNDGHESRYKWFIDTDDPHNMVWSGSNVYEAEFLLFVEDSPNSSPDGSGDVYLLHNDGDGFGEYWPDYYLSTPGPILDKSIAGYRIIDHCIDVYICQVEIGNPLYSYFTWATDPKDSNPEASSNERSDNFCNPNLSKADLSIEASDSADPVYPGDSLTYTLNVTNHGPHNAENIYIKDILPANVTFINAVPAQNGITGQTVWWDFSSLAVDTSVFITVNVIINDDTTAGVIWNIAVAYSGTYDPMPGDNNASVDTTIGLDTDGDGIPDCVDTDDDNDGYSDLDELACGSDPLDNESLPDDFDSDFIPDCIDDSDGDGWTDGDEIAAGTDPLDPNSYPDFVPPSNVTGLTVTDAKDGKLSLSWDAATDNIGVDHYEICRDGILLLNITGTSYQDTGLVNGQSYNYTVRAVDAAGNKGNFSNPASGTPTKTSTSYIPPTDNPAEAGNNAPIANTSAGEPSLGIGYETITLNASYSPLSQPIITGPSEGYIDIVYNFSIISNDSDIDIKFIINWGDGNINESSYIAPGSVLTIYHKWVQPRQYTITVTATDGQTNTTTSKAINIYIPTEPAAIPGYGNFSLILLILAALSLLLLIGKRKKDDKEEDKK